MIPRFCGCASSLLLVCHLNSDGVLQLLLVGQLSNSTFEF